MNRRTGLIIAAICMVLGAMAIAWFAGVKSAPAVTPGPQHHVPTPRVTVQIHGHYNNTLHV